MRTPARIFWSVALVAISSAACKAPPEVTNALQREFIEPVLTMRSDLARQEPKKVIRLAYAYYVDNARWPTNRSELTPLASKTGDLETLLSFRDINFTPEPDASCKVVFMRRDYKMSVFLPKP